MVERVRSAEAKVAAAAVAEVVAARETAERARREMVAGGRAALAEGDRVGWASAQWARGACEGRVTGLMKVQVVREAVRDEAMVAYRASRMQTEQVDRVLAGEMERLHLEEERRVQAAADDRFGSRQAWVKGR